MHVPFDGKVHLVHVALFQNPIEQKHNFTIPPRIFGLKIKPFSDNPMDPR